MELHKWQMESSTLSSRQIFRKGMFNMAEKKFLDYDGLSLYNSNLKEYLSQNKEDKINKVTALTVTATNTQYPSAKAVVDYAKQLEDNLKAYINEIILGGEW